jgi:transcriptional regulator with XRE-family HTH domain
MKIRKAQQSKNINPKDSKAITIIAKRVRELRYKKMISQEYLAELCDLHRNYIGQLERSEVNVSIVTLEAIAKALDVSLIEFLVPEI